MPNRLASPPRSSGTTGQPSARELLDERVPPLQAALLILQAGAAARLQDSRPARRRTASATSGFGQSTKIGPFASIGSTGACLSYGAAEAFASSADAMDGNRDVHIALKNQRRAPTTARRRTHAVRPIHPLD